MNSINSPAPTTVNHPQQNQNNYSRAVKQPAPNMFPKKDQAIILNTQDELKVADYIIAIGNIVQPKNIIFASRISNNRICVYLSSVEHVNNIVDNHNIIKIGEHNLTVRRLITPAKRIILSNVCPSIPHKIIEQALQHTNIQPVSPISFLKATYISEEYNHILSFRRQVYIKPDENLQLPPTILIEYEDIAYRIFLCYDDITCFICKNKGHISKQCPDAKETELEFPPLSSTSNTLSNEPNNSSKNKQTNIIPQVIHNTPTTEHTKPNEQITYPQKRTATTIESTSTENLIQLTGEDTHVNKDSESPFLIPNLDKNQSKKLKRQNSKKEELPPLEELLKPIKQKYQDCKSTITFELFVDYLENAYGNPDPLSLARIYKMNVPELLQVMTTIHPNIEHRAIKGRITRISNKIKKQINGNTDDSDTDSSQKSSKENHVTCTMES